MLPTDMLPCALGYKANSCATQLCTPAHTKAQTPPLLDNISIRTQKSNPTIAMDRIACYRRIRGLFRYIKWHAGASPRVDMTDFTGLTSCVCSIVRLVI
jgi:hypothetical protein